MRTDSVFKRFTSFDDSGPWGGSRPCGRSKVLLREPEVCRECGEVFQSLYPLRSCEDHDGLDRI